MLSGFGRVGLSSFFSWERPLIYFLSLGVLLVTSYFCFIISMSIFFFSFISIYLLFNYCLTVSILSFFYRWLNKLSLLAFPSCPPRLPYLTYDYYRLLFFSCFYLSTMAGDAFGAMNLCSLMIFLSRETSRL